MINSSINSSGGISGYFSKSKDTIINKNILKIIASLKSLQHRGNNYWGFGFDYNDQISVIKNNGIVKNIYSEIEKNNFLPISTIGYVSDNNEPIIYLPNKEALLVLNIENPIKEDYDNIVKILDSNEKSLLKNLTGMIEENSDLFKKIYNIAILKSNNLYLYRCENGRKPLLIGEDKETYYFSNESKTFKILGGEMIREIIAGELLKINSEGIKIIKEGKNENEKFCSMELCHILDMDTNLGILNINQFRNDFAILMAERDIGKFGEDDSIVCGFPNQAIIPGITYAQFLGIPYGQFILKDQKVNDEIIYESLVRNKIVIVVFTILIIDEYFNILLEKLKDYGVKEIHIRVLSPQIKGFDNANNNLITSINFLRRKILDLSIKRKLEHSFFA